MTGAEVLAIGLLLVAGFLIGGVVSFWPRNRPVAGVLAVLAALALAGAVLRFLPA